jgi:excisionase family DNA binding protein
MAEKSSRAEQEIPRLLTLGEAAELLGVTRRTVNDWAADRLRVTYLGPRTPRILETDLLAFIDAARRASRE